MWEGGRERGGGETAAGIYIRMWEGGRERGGENCSWYIYTYVGGREGERGEGGSVYLKSGCLQPNVLIFGADF